MFSHIAGSLTAMVVIPATWYYIRTLKNVGRRS